MIMMIMMCDDLMCTYKLTRIQLSLAHNAKVKMPSLINLSSVQRLR